MGEEVGRGEQAVEGRVGKGRKAMEWLMLDNFACSWF